MLASIQDQFPEFAAALALAPKEAVSALILLVVGLLALAVHAIVVRFLRRLLSTKHPYWSALLRATYGPTRLALLVAVLALVLPATAFDPAISDGVDVYLTGYSSLASNEPLSTAVQGSAVAGSGVTICGAMPSVKVPASWLAKRVTWVRFPLPSNVRAVT